MNEIESSLIPSARYQLLYYPQMNYKENMKKLAKYMIKRNTSKTDRFFWSHALLTQALESVENIQHDEQNILTLQQYYDKWIKYGQKIHYIDNAMNGYSMLYLVQLTNNKIYENACENIYQYLSRITKAKDGSIPYRTNNSQVIFADGIGMICPFLCRYGEMYKRQEAIDLAVLQINNFLQFGMDAHSGLPYHGYHAVTGKKKGIIGWGRAVGWILWGIVDSIEYLEFNSKQRQELETTYIHLVEHVLLYWQEKKGFTWQITACDGEIDTSATSMILYAIEKGISLGILSREQCLIVENGREILKQYIKNGLIEQCSCECLDFCMYPQNYSTYPWSLGPGLRYLVLREDNK